MKSKKWVDLLLYSNIFISFCATAVTAETYLLVNLEVNIVYLFFVFSCTLVFYDFPSLLFAENSFSAKQSERHKWILENRKLLLILSVLGFIAVAVSVFFFSIKFILSLIPTSLLAFAYFFPQTQLRNVTGLKTIIVTFVWTMITVFYPLLLNANLDLVDFWKRDIGIIVFQNFLFIFPLCVIYNVRDMEADRKAGVKTIPVVYGIRTTIIICLVSLLLFSVVVLFSVPLQEKRPGLLISVVPTAILLLAASEKRSDYYYSFWIDGMILLQAGLVWGISLNNN